MDQDRLPQSIFRPSARLTSVPLAGAALWVILATPLSGGSPGPVSWPPPTLQETGLYSDWATKTIAAENLPFSPQYPLWTDGATKSRWLHIPEGQFIDGSNPDVWQFPAGTRLWKEFRFERRAETRFIEHTPEGWKYAAYAWSSDENEAPVAPESGIRRGAMIRDGIQHAIPSRGDCRACHEAGPVRVLGVSALQLSPDRDPGALHAHPRLPGAVDLPGLVERGLVRGLPPHLTRTAPRIVAATPTTRAALGYLHANCGTCHTSLADMSSLSFALNYTLDHAEDQAPPAVLTSLGQPSRFRIADAPEVVSRVSPGRPDASVLVRRMASRHPIVQMPPLGTRIVDEEAVKLIRRWIEEDLGSAAPQGAGNAQP